MGVVAIVCVTAILVPAHRARRQQIREDFQVFVRSVAVAARLCEHAAPWKNPRERRLPCRAAQRTFAVTEPLHFKNVQAHVATYRRSAAPVAGQASSLL